MFRLLLVKFLLMTTLLVQFIVCICDAIGLDLPAIRFYVFSGSNNSNVPGTPYIN